MLFRIGKGGVIEVNHAISVFPDFVKNVMGCITQWFLENIPEEGTNFVISNRLKIPVQVSLFFGGSLSAADKTPVLMGQRNLQQNFNCSPEADNGELWLCCFQLLPRLVQKFQTVVNQGLNVSLTVRK